MQISFKLQIQRAHNHPPFLRNGKRIHRSSSFTAQRSAIHRGTGSKSLQGLRLVPLRVDTNPLISFYKASSRDPWTACQVMGRQDTSPGRHTAIGPLESPLSLTFRRTSIDDIVSPFFLSFSRLPTLLTLLFLLPLSPSLYLSRRFSIFPEEAEEGARTERACHAKGRQKREGRVLFVRS